MLVSPDGLKILVRNNSAQEETVLVGIQSDSYVRVRSELTMPCQTNTSPFLYSLPPPHSPSRPYNCLRSTGVVAAVDDRLALQMIIGKELRVYTIRL
nr:hypothetical protein HmN_000579800 [Hymenolepis microstoma]